MSFLAKDANGTNQNLPLYDPQYQASATIVPGAAPTTIVQLTGAASTKMRIKYVELAFVGAISATVKAMSLNLRSTAASGGTPVTPTLGKSDQSDAAAAGVVTHYTAAPTAGSLTAVVRSAYIGSGTAQTPDRLRWEFTTHGDKALTLSSASQFLTIDMGAALEASQNLSYTIVWEEGSA